jgi:hypothetical protein
MNMIHQFIKGTGSRKHINVGVLIGYKQGESVYISGSKANLSKGDKFDKTTGIELAKKRLCNLDSGRPVKIAASMEKPLEKFKTRCQKYFKTEQIVSPELRSMERNHKHW